MKGQAEAEVEILQVHLAEIKVPSVWCGENYWVGSHKEKWKDFGQTDEKDLGSTIY